MGVLLPMMETDSAAFLSQSDACWQKNIDWMLQQGPDRQGTCSGRRTGQPEVLIRANTCRIQGQKRVKCQM